MSQFWRLMLVYKTWNVATQDVPPDTPTPTKEDVVYVAYADVRVRLDDAGLLLLLHRPVQQAVTLGKGMTTVKAKMDERVELSIPENFDGQITGELQVIFSVSFCLVGLGICNNNNNFCIALFSGVHKLTALYNILQHFLSFTNMVHIIMTTNNV